MLTWFTLDCIQIGGALCEVFLVDLNASATRQSVLAQEKCTLNTYYCLQISFSFDSLMLREFVNLKNYLSIFP